MKKLFSIIVVICLIFSISSTTAFAATTQTSATKKFEVVSKYQSTVASNGKVEVTLSIADSIRFEKGILGISIDPNEIRYDEATKKYTFVYTSKTSSNLTVEISKLIVNVTGTSKSATLSTADKTKYLSKESRIETDNAKIKEKSLALVKALTTDEAKAKAIFEYVAKNMVYTTDKLYANKGAASAITNLKGVCEDYANLMVAMCRVSNIPARMVYGYTVNGDEKIAHAWCEVYYGGAWHSMEPTINSKDPVKYGFDRLSAAVYYYQLGYEPDELAGSAILRVGNGTSNVTRTTVWLARTN